MWHLAHIQHLVSFSEKPWITLTICKHSTYSEIPILLWQYQGLIIPEQQQQSFQSSTSCPPPMLLHAFLCYAANSSVYRSVCSSHSVDLITFTKFLPACPPTQVPSLHNAIQKYHIFTSKFPSCTPNMNRGSFLKSQHHPLEFAIRIQFQHFIINST